MFLKCSEYLFLFCNIKLNTILQALPVSYKLHSIYQLFTLKMILVKFLQMKVFKSYVLWVLSWHQEYLLVAQFAKTSQNIG